MSLPSTFHVFDPRPEFPFLVTARRYIPPRPSATGCTLVFAHGTGYHKELWEPCLERIFELAGSKGYPIREAWSLDAPGHGDAGILNATVLRSGYSVLCNWQDYGRAINLFLTQFEDGYFRGHYLIGIGHSMGAVALILAVTFKPMLHFESVVLCDPMMYSQEIDEGPFIRKTVGGFVEGGKRRRDIWPSKKDALEGFLKRPAFQRWNRKALEIYCEHGLVELPTLNYPDKSGVTLKCFKDHERVRGDCLSFVLSF
ncbi:hypothetical protein SISNIDRAFT_450527 [Sistotremastrum niveocremeum HHB9708]|uniref:AB hydrolase-1 domain-containing protein n=1 Tax=Sistotremastrum niveocremeum HHB9708 TaxID=1314777 RepID=A0A164YCJ6_9AGAM|nr:hypothetical protein SISNIDRAFT_450527 [Sistotremastrum niveocremeum HHB9708]